MYHPYKKDSSYVREALYKVYGCKCSYCNANLELRHMHVDHILPTNRAVLSVQLTINTNTETLNIT